MKFVFCPICGHKLLEGENNSHIKVKCGKCKTIIEVKIIEKGIIVVPIKPIN